MTSSRLRLRTHLRRRRSASARSARACRASSHCSTAAAASSARYGKVLVAEDEPVAYCQFGPLSAYPRALRLRDLYPQLPNSPLPAVITCIATTADARRQGYARRLVDDVCRDLAERGFAAVEAYPDLTRPEDETSGARPGFWHKMGFETAVDDERFPVMRREL